MHKQQTVTLTVTTTTTKVERQQQRFLEKDQCGSTIFLEIKT